MHIDVRRGAQGGTRAGGLLHGATTVIAALSLAGCSSPLQDRAEQELRRAAIDAARRELADAEGYPETRITERAGGIDRLGIKPELLAELAREAGPAAYDPARMPLEKNLYGRESRVVHVSLERAVRTAIEHNLAVQFARIAPAITEAQVLAAESAFDWTLFSSVDWSATDQPRVASSTGTTPLSVAFDQQQNIATQIGLRRPLRTGGRFTVQQNFNYTDNETRGLFTNPDPANTLALALQFEQPLLRGFGTDVAEAEVRLARNAERDSVAQARLELLRQVSDVERTYWELAQAQRNILVLRRLLERGEATRDRLETRQNMDASPSQRAAAKARVEERIGQIIRAELVLRQTSDRLKALMSDPELSVGAEVIVLPADDLIDEPISYNLLDAVTSAIRTRPEVERALLAIDDTSVRALVADNARLPQLDLRLQARLNSLRDDVASSYDYIFNGQFIDYLIGLNFEYAIGNRRAEADFRRRRLERMQATIAYRRAVQDVTLEVKAALESVVSYYRLLAHTAATRVAAAEELRALQVEQTLKLGLTAEGLNLELTRQEALAAREQDEIVALVEYNRAIASLHQAMGTALERNRIRFVVPEASEFARPR